MVSTEKFHIEAHDHDCIQLSDNVALLVELFGLKSLILLVDQSVTERSLKLVLFSISDIYVRNQEVAVKIAYKLP